MLRGADERNPMQSKVSLEAAAVDRSTVTEFFSRVHELLTEHDVYRGQVVSLSNRPPMGQLIVTFHDRVAVDRDAIVLAPGVLEHVERQTVEVGRQRERLLASGRHLKRGILLHGPPGTGKTLTVRYIANLMADATVLVLSGPGLGLIGPTCAMARGLQPAVVVLEDFDLVAEERTMPGGGRNPLLFQLLNEMDGLEADADVTFVLTTNRPDILEPALAARTGRIDAAIEIALPDDEGRARLLELYGRGLDLDVSDWDDIVARTDGVSGAFIKELLRKAALVAAQGTDTTPIHVSEAHISAALDELMSEAGELTKILLGGAAGRPPPTTRESMRWMPGAAPVQLDRPGHV
jgi:hypothetical protein